jgi:hypothetical protein
VAVPTEENALPGLLTRAINPAAEAASRESEGLVCWIDVMELQRRREAVIAACCTAAAGLRDQDSLDATASLRDSLLRA